MMNNCDEFDAGRKRKKASVGRRKYKTLIAGQEVRQFVRCRDERRVNDVFMLHDPM